MAFQFLPRAACRPIFKFLHTLLVFTTNFPFWLIKASSNLFQLLEIRNTLTELHHRKINQHHRPLALPGLGSNLGPTECSSVV